jgi:hypothetical protein
MSVATQQKAKGLSQQWWNSQASRIPQGNQRNSDSMQNFVDNRVNRFTQQGKADYWNQYNTQLKDMNLARQYSESYQINNQRRQDEQRVADRNTNILNAEADRNQQMRLARQSQFGDANVTGRTSVTNTTFDPNSTMQMRMFREQRDAEVQKDAREKNAQIDMMNRQASINSQATAQQRVYESGERAKDRATSMYQAMWNSFNGGGQYGYRYW